MIQEFCDLDPYPGRVLDLSKLPLILVSQFPHLDCVWDGEGSSIQVYFQFQFGEIWESMKTQNTRTP